MNQPIPKEQAVAIRLESVSRRFALPGGEHFDAVRDVSLEVAAGDVYGLIGTSGAGKSASSSSAARTVRPV